VSDGVREAARGLESLLWRQLLRSMRSTVRPAGPWSGGRGGAVFTDLLDQALASAAASRGALRLENAIARRYA